MDILGYVNMFFNKEEIKATTLIYKENEYMIDIPKAEYWTNNIEVKFIISFHNSIDKQNFLKEYRKRENLKIDYYIYSKCRVLNIRKTNMVRCYALRKYDDSDILEKIFNGEIPF